MRFRDPARTLHCIAQKDVRSPSSIHICWAHCRCSTQHIVNMSTASSPASSPSISPLPAPSSPSPSPTLPSASSPPSSHSTQSSHSSHLSAAILESSAHSSLASQLQALLDSYPALAQHSIQHTLPLKLAELSSLHAHFSSLPPPPAPALSPLGCPPCAALLGLVSAIKAEVNALLLALDPIRTAIALTIPRIHDNKSTASQTKEDIVDMLSQGRASAQGVLDGLTRYYTQRGKLVTKAIKYPEVEDFVRAVEEVDRKQWRTLLAMLSDLRANYAVIYDTCTKNEDKLTAADPGSSYDYMHG